MNVQDRWEKGIPHNPRSIELAKKLEQIDSENGYFFDWRFGGDGDGGEMLLYHLDIAFEEK